MATAKPVSKRAYFKLILKIADAQRYLSHREMEKLTGWTRKGVDQLLTSARAIPWMRVEQDAARRYRFTVDIALRAICDQWSPDAVPPTALFDFYRDLATAVIARRASLAEKYAAATWVVADTKKADATALLDWIESELDRAESTQAMVPTICATFYHRLRAMIVVSRETNRDDRKRGSGRDAENTLLIEQVRLLDGIATELARFNRSVQHLRDSVDQTSPMQPAAAGGD